MAHRPRQNESWSPIYESAESSWRPRNRKQPTPATPANSLAVIALKDASSKRLKNTPVDSKDKPKTRNLKLKDEVARQFKKKKSKVLRLFHQTPSTNDRREKEEKAKAKKELSEKNKLHALRAELGKKEIRLLRDIVKAEEELKKIEIKRHAIDRKLKEPSPFTL